MSNVLEITRQYQIFISEVKFRIISIIEMTERLNGISPQIVHETIQLQFRLCCEAIALGLLTINKPDLAGLRNDVFGKYQPGAIMTELEKLHPEFYPVPKKATKTPIGWHLEDDEILRATFLDKNRLKELWDNAGKELHKGTFKSIERGTRKAKQDYEDITNQIAAFRCFLSFHTVLNPERTHLIICEGNLADWKAPVNCFSASATI